MCTAAWLLESNGHQLFCNRDERRTRKLALPPRLRERNGVKYLAPVDGKDVRVLWMGWFGLTAALAFFLLLAKPNKPIVIGRHNIATTEDADDPQRVLVFDHGQFFAVGRAKLAQG